MKALDREGKEVRIKATETLLAQALEHEIDHINGILYIDHLDERRRADPDAAVDRRRRAAGGRGQPRLTRAARAGWS